MRRNRQSCNRSIVNSFFPTSGVVRIPGKGEFHASSFPQVSDAGSGRRRRDDWLHDVCRRCPDAVPPDRRGSAPKRLRLAVGRHTRQRRAGALDLPDARAAGARDGGDRGGRVRPRLLRERHVQRETTPPGARPSVRPTCQRPRRAKADIDKQTAQMDKAMAEAKAAMANMPPEMRKMMEATMKQAGAEGADLDSQLAELQKEGQKGMKETEGRAGQGRRQARRGSPEREAVRPALSGQPRQVHRRPVARVPCAVGDGAGRRRSRAPRRQDGVRRSGARKQARVRGSNSIARARPSVDAARAAATSWLATLDRKQM